MMCLRTIKHCKMKLVLLKTFITNLYCLHDISLCLSQYLSNAIFFSQSGFFPKFHFMDCLASSHMSLNLIVLHIQFGLTLLSCSEFYNKNTLPGIPCKSSSMHL